MPTFFRLLPTIQAFLHARGFFDVSLRSISKVILGFSKARKKFAIKDATWKKRPQTTNENFQNRKFSVQKKMKNFSLKWVKMDKCKIFFNYFKPNKIIYKRKLEILPKNFENLRMKEILKFVNAKVILTTASHNCKGEDSPFICINIFGILSIDVLK